MLKQLRNTAFALAIAASAIPAVHADDPVSSAMSAWVVETSDGVERLVKAESAAPDDVIEYQIVYRNTGPAAVQGLAVTGPVPGSTEYLATTAMSAADHRLLVSVDDGVTFEKEPVIRRETGADGVVHDLIVDASEYTHVHWQLTEPMPATEARTFSYRVRVR